MKIALAQINTTVGDLEGNLRRIKKYLAKARKSHSDLVAFPELALIGYPPQDLLIQTDIVDRSMETLKTLEEDTKDIVAAIGFVEQEGDRLYNSTAILQDGGLTATARKTHLPTYDVFDEARYFTPSNQIEPITLHLQDTNVTVGFEVCEDLWNHQYPVDVTHTLAEKGASLIINISASPYHVGKTQERIRLLQSNSRKNHVPIFYVNQVGGQDELVFDGQSLAVDRRGKLIAIGASFKEDLVIADLNLEGGEASEVEAPHTPREEEMFNALVLGVRDYYRKTGFKKAVVGLSGGIDSSLTAVIAAEALGKENVLGVSMPSRYSSQHSREDSEELAKNLGIHHVTVSIEEVYQAFEQTLKHLFIHLEPDVTEENLQARIRGTILMAISNKLGHLVLGTGNKTELALGYCTLYGDMVAGLGALSDVSKMEVYELARYYNRRIGASVIPENCFLKRPSAELREGQVDPFDYSVVSPLVDEIVEGRLGRRELIERGYDVNLVDDIFRRMKKAEFKRRQAAPGIKITKKAFGIGWKMPIVNKYV